MTAISPTDGPIAVTGASGYIGSWIVQDLIEQGYPVRACVRDVAKPEKVDHLLAMNDAGLEGHVELFAAVIGEPGRTTISPRTGTSPMPWPRRAPNR